MRPEQRDDVACVPPPAPPSPPARQRPTPAQWPLITLRALRLPERRTRVPRPQVPQRRRPPAVRARAPVHATVRHGRPRRRTPEATHSRERVPPLALRVGRAAVARAVGRVPGELSARARDESGAVGDNEGPEGARLARIVAGAQGGPVMPRGAGHARGVRRCRVLRQRRAAHARRAERAIRMEVEQLERREAGDVPRAVGDARQAVAGAGRVGEAMRARRRRAQHAAVHHVADCRPEVHATCVRAGTRHQRKALPSECTPHGRRTANATAPRQRVDGDVRGDRSERVHGARCPADRQGHTAQVDEGHRAGAEHDVHGGVLGEPLSARERRGGRVHPRRRGRALRLAVACGVSTRIGICISPMGRPIRDMHMSNTAAHAGQHIAAGTGIPICICPMGWPTREMHMSAAAAHPTASSGSESFTGCTPGPRSYSTREASVTVP